MAPTAYARFRQGTNVEIFAAASSARFSATSVYTSAVNAA
jgi:hypothetical protein